MTNTTATVLTANTVDNLYTSTCDIENVSSVKVDGVTFYSVNGAQSDIVWAWSPRLAERKILVRVVDTFERINGLNASAIPANFDYVCCGSALGKDTSNEKLAKTAKRFANVESWICYRAPFNVAGKRFNECDHASKDCARFCLNTAGKGTLPSVQLARIARTRVAAMNPVLWWDLFNRDYATAKRGAAKRGKQLAIRPNGTSDQLQPELIEIIRDNPETVFYDYTAQPSRVAVAVDLPNYHITLSRKETESNRQWIKGAWWSLNVAVVVTAECKAALLRDHASRVVDGDAHDYRVPEVDGYGVAVLLTAKGELRGKDSGMIHDDPAKVLDLLTDRKGAGASRFGA